METLLTSLLDLLTELAGPSSPLVLGGGFGLYLKRAHLTATGQQTLFPLERLPQPRATNDLDLFVRTEVLADHARTDAIRGAIVRLGYEPVPTSKYWQWVKQEPQLITIDILVGPLGPHAPAIHPDKRRARPRQKIDFHARRTEEAITVEEEPTQVVVRGRLSNGKPVDATIHVPHAFPYLMMKLHAFEDRREDPKKELGRHHALDLYTIVGLMTEAEYDRAKHLGAELARDNRVVQARKIVREHFGERTHPGALRLREHHLFRDDFLLDEFFAVLREVFPP
jgi:hypothetical protein